MRFCRPKRSHSKVGRRRSSEPRRSSDSDAKISQNVIAPRLEIPVLVFGTGFVFCPVNCGSATAVRFLHLFKFGLVVLGGQPPGAAGNREIPCCFFSRSPGLHEKTASNFCLTRFPVPRTRLELARTKRSLPPQSSVSTNFTTWATLPKLAIREHKYSA